MSINKWQLGFIKFLLLFPYQHLPSGGKFTRSQRIEIHTTRYRLTYRVSTIPIRRTPFALIDTDHSYQRDALNRIINTPLGSRVDRVAGALFYMYLLGWYTGFIQMPFFSIQDLLSVLPYPVPGDEARSVLRSIDNQENLRRYRSLASLFVNEGDQRFDVEHFGFLTPEETLLKYRDTYGGRFDGYFGNTLGAFLQKVPSQYRQQ